MLKSVFLGVFLLLLFPSVVHAQVVINEIYPNANDNEDEWVELFNTNTDPESLKSCVLYLDANNIVSQTISFGDEDFVDEYKVIPWTGSKLSNDGDTVRFECNSTLQDSVPYGNESGAVVVSPDKGISVGRSPNGTGSFVKLTSVTMQGPNSSANTPTPTSTPTPTPTSTPTPTPTPKASSTPVATKTPTPRPTSTSLANSEEEKATDPNAVLGLREELKTPTPTPSTQEGGKSIPVVAIGFIVLGVGFMGFGGYTFLQQMRSGYTE